MYVEWWMWLVFLAWWMLSINHISRDIRKKSFADGVDAGVDNTLKVLEQKGLIEIDGEFIKTMKKN